MKKLVSLTVFLNSLMMILDSGLVFMAVTVAFDLMDVRTLQMGIDHNTRNKLVCVLYIPIFLNNERRFVIIIIHHFFIIFEFLAPLYYTSNVLHFNCPAITTI